MLSVQLKARDLTTRSESQGEFSAVKHLGIGVPIADALDMMTAGDLVSGCDALCDAILQLFQADARRQNRHGRAVNYGRNTHAALTRMKSEAEMFRGFVRDIKEAHGDV